MKKEKTEVVDDKQIEVTDFNRQMKIEDIVNEIEDIGILEDIECFISERITDIRCGDYSE